jgi:tetratricopeptide (TPR) repeat protein
MKAEYNRAIADFKEAKRLHPRLRDFVFYPAPAQAFYNRGYSWHSIRDYDRAIADYTEAIRLRQGFFADAHFSRGNAWFSKNEYDRAIADYNEAIRINPRDADAYTWRGLSWSLKGSYELAIRDYDQSIQLTPSHWYSYYLRGLARETIGQLQNALLDMRAALSRGQTLRAMNETRNITDSIARLERRITQSNQASSNNIQRNSASNLAQSDSDFNAAMRLLEEAQKDLMSTLSRYDRIQR